MVPFICSTWLDFCSLRILLDRFTAREHGRPQLDRRFLFGLDRNLRSSAARGFGFVLAAHSRNV